MDGRLATVGWLVGWGDGCLELASIIIIIIIIIIMLDVDEWDLCMYVGPSRGWGGTE